MICLMRILCTRTHCDLSISLYHTLFHLHNIQSSLFLSLWVRQALVQSPQKQVHMLASEQNSSGQIQQTDDDDDDEVLLHS